MDMKYKHKTFPKKRKFNFKGFQAWAALAMIMVIFGFPDMALAQLLCETEPATTDPTNTHSSNRFLDAVIVGVAIMIVLVTLAMSIKYLFKPGESSPDHIKNIIKDEGF